LETASFHFGPLRQHHAKATFGPIGRERYFVNGHLVHSNWSLALTGVREFIAEGHRVQIRVSVGLRAAHGEAWVDGKLVEPELFAAFNSKLFERRSARRSTLRHGRLSFRQWSLRVALWFVVSLLVFKALKALTANL
jgi:hypothetical protein